jgi:hypothetical protein
MRLLKGTSTASVVLSTALAATLFAATTFAQDTSLPNLSTITNQPAASTADSSKPAASTNAKSSDGSQSSSNSRSKIVITASTTSSRSDTAAAPKITGTATATDRPALSGVPKLSGQFSIIPASVPPTQNAPYMKVSRLPEGTVFIAVGSLLAFLAFAVLAWRGLIAWSLHRSVKRAAMHSGMADTKAHFRTPAAPMFKYSDLDSAQSMVSLGGKNGKKGRANSSVPPVPSNRQSLFFSPTAGAAGVGGGSLAGNRGSTYLPAGYYAAGAAAPGAGNGAINMGASSRESITLSNLRPHSQGYTRARSQGPSPPDSPHFPATLRHSMNPSTSTLDLNYPRTNAPRAPSAYLEDLFNESGPPPAPYPHGGPRF